MSHIYLKGLNTLRFFAAFFVIIFHGAESLAKINDPTILNYSVFNRGGDAVEFFYVLSGFLITYLLQAEIAKTGTVSIRKFYLRRVFRIWPLYFLVVAFGFLFLGFIYPHMTGQQYFNFPIYKGVLLFLCFLPNLATSLYPTGLLFPLRTIGVEEQYYLFWSPLVKVFRSHVGYLIVSFVVLSYIGYYWLEAIRPQLSYTLGAFLESLKFYAMATGGLFGFIFFRYSQRYRESWFCSKWMQWIIFIFTGWYYLGGIPIISDSIIGHFFLCWVYGLLILNNCVPEKPVINLEKQPFIYLGAISYGLYCWNMVVEYFLRFTATKFHLERLNPRVSSPLYLAALLGGAIILAGLSHKYYESYFLRLKERYA